MLPYRSLLQFNRTFVIWPLVDLVKTLTQPPPPPPPPPFSLFTSYAVMHKLWRYCVLLEYNYQHSVSGQYTFVIKLNLDGLHTPRFDPIWVWTHNLRNTSCPWHFSVAHWTIRHLAFRAKFIIRISFSSDFYAIFISHNPLGYIQGRLNHMTGESRDIYPVWRWSRCRWE